jgi:hypothetical protein
LGVNRGRTRSHRLHPVQLANDHDQAVKWILSFDAVLDLESRSSHDCISPPSYPSARAFSLLTSLAIIQFSPGTGPARLQLLVGLCFDCISSTAWFVGATEALPLPDEVLCPSSCAPRLGINIIIKRPSPLQEANGMLTRPGAGRASFGGSGRSAGCQAGKKDILDDELERQQVARLN